MQSFELVGIWLRPMFQPASSIALLWFIRVKKRALYNTHSGQWEPTAREHFENPYSVHCRAWACCVPRLGLAFVM